MELETGGFGCFEAVKHYRVDGGFLAGDKENKKKTRTCLSKSWKLANGNKNATITFRFLSHKKKL